MQELQRLVELRDRGLWQEGKRKEPMSGNYCVPNCAPPLSAVLCFVTIYSKSSSLRQHMSIISYFSVGQGSEHSLAGMFSSQPLTVSEVWARAVVPSKDSTGVGPLSHSVTRLLAGFCSLRVSVPSWLLTRSCPLFYAMRSLQRTVYKMAA